MHKWLMGGATPRPWMPTTPPPLSIGERPPGRGGGGFWEGGFWEGQWGGVLGGAFGGVGAMSTGY